MFSLSRKCIVIVLAAWAIKIVLIPLPPLTGDFSNWIRGSQHVFTLIINGKLPSVGTFGVFLGIYLVLAPFYWLWTLLPIQHVILAEMVVHPSLARYSLMYVMKSPIVVSDFFTGLLVYNLVGKANPSKASKAFLSWHLNPYNWYWLYWSTTMDVIPAVIVLLAILYGVNRKWSRCALCLFSATVLRLYPILLLPFFMVYAYWVEGRALTKHLASFLALFATPLLVIIFFQGYVSGSLQAAISIFLQFPVRQPELPDVLGFRLSTFFTLGPFLLLLQLYFAFARWKRETALALLVLAPLLVFFASGTSYGAHLVWASPLLSVYAALDNDWFLFSLTFISAFLSPITTVGPFVQYFGWDTTYQGAQPVIDLLGPCMSGVHYGTRMVYLLKLNLDRLRWG
jgi:hypothetical protein